MRRCFWSTQAGARTNTRVHTRLLTCLSPEQPLYGLQAIGLDGKQEPKSSFEDLADVYVREICEV